MLCYLHVFSSPCFKTRQVKRRTRLRLSVSCLHYCSRPWFLLDWPHVKINNPPSYISQTFLLEVRCISSVSRSARRGLFISWSSASNFIVSAPFRPTPETGSRAIKYRINDINLAVDISNLLHNTYFPQVGQSPEQTWATSNWCTQSFRYRKWKQRVPWS
jgi:hypothetical protein